MAETFYGEWFPWGDRYRIDRPQWSLWLVELRTDLLVTAVWMGSDWYESDGRTIDSVGPNRIRRVYPPGSVLPEPRKWTEVDTSQWPWWQFDDHWVHTPDGIQCVANRGWIYPVQPLQNGVFVPVPWFAVGVVK